jgi:cytochrome c oxidase subunit I+III
VNEDVAELDYRHLPMHPAGGRAFVWSGMVLFLLIEGTVVASLVTSYFYFRVMAAAGWPPPGVPLPQLTSPAVAVALLALSFLLVWVAQRARRFGRRKGFRGAGFAACGLLAAYVAWSLRELSELPFTWFDHAYGSLVWTLSGYQLLHGFVLLSLGLGVLLLGKRHERSPLEEDSSFDSAWGVLRLYWVFVVLASIPMYGALYLVPYLG